MRDLLRGHADRGATVLLSSHLLHEIDVVADDLVVIGTGRIVAAGTKADLLATGSIQVRTRHPERLTDALTSEGITYAETGTRPPARDRTDGAPCRTLRVDADAEWVGRIAHRAGVPLIELRTADGAGLEDMFLQLTAGTQREGAVA
jgi:ABC-2 type transport system ATP-binding protein